jgi:surface antigen
MEMKIVDMQRSTQSGCVTTAHWTATKQDGDYTASAYGSIGLPVKDPSDPTFVAYEDITEAQAVEWVKDVMGQEQVEALEANLDGQIEAQKHPTQASGTPWSA